jgi:hypothetical protein
VNCLLRFREFAALSFRFVLLRRRVEVRGIPHLAKNERNTPNFLHAALDKSVCAPFVKERRMRFIEATEPHRKSGIWGTRDCPRGQSGFAVLARTFSPDLPAPTPTLLSSIQGKRLLATPVVFVPGTLWRTWGTRPVPFGFWRGGEFWKNVRTKRTMRTK